MSLIRKHVAVLQAWACLDLVLIIIILRFLPSVDFDLLNWKSVQTDGQTDGRTRLVMRPIRTVAY